MTPIESLEKWIIRKGPKIRAEKTRITKIMNEIKKQIARLEKEVKNAPRDSHSNKGQGSEGLPGKCSVCLESEISKKSKRVSRNTKKRPKGNGGAEWNEQGRKPSV